MVAIWARLSLAETSQALAQAVGIVCVTDGTTFTALKKTEVYVVILRFFNPDTLSVRECSAGLIGFDEGEETDGLTIFKKIRVKCADVGLPVTRVTGVCSDCGSNLAGHHTGVVGYMRKRAHPTCQHLRDLSHRFETFCNKAFAESVVDELVKVWEKIESTFRTSGKLYRKFRLYAKQNNHTNLLSPANCDVCRSVPHSCLARAACGQLFLVFWSTVVEHGTVRIEPQTKTTTMTCGKSL
eukprot:TRINITY_DN10630_c0_g1_i3.p1 TRINITY_DN10630_c0_g1~~TRINITY_DN10630_c0_g1_i3.p1  ORF type:complete len:240 (-),score=13.24 TRINITY_DN10630_c0_g1_i3:528-1247(-)